MSLFLFRPHVVGPGGNVTTPDVVVDRVFVNGTVRPVGSLTHECWQQTDVDETAAAGYGVMALGGGALLVPALVMGSGIIVIARQAWRLNNLDGHIGQVALNGTALADVGLPEAEITAAGGTGDALPRGYLLVRVIEGSNTRQAELCDPVKERSLTLRIFFEDMARDRWGDARPRPRYSIGPTQREIPHFI